VSSGFSAGLSGSQGTVFSADLLKRLYNSTLSAAGAIDPATATSRVNQLFTGGTNILDQLGGGAGQDYLTKRLSGDNSDILNAQIDALGSDLGRFYTQNLNPAITGNAVAAGQLGGGRQGVAQGIATENVTREFATQAANLRAADVTNRDQAALGLINGTNASSATALGALPSLASLGSGASVLDPLKAASSIFGAPTVTTESFGQEMSQQQAEEYATSLAQELGISYDEAHALLKSTSKGSSTGGILPALSGFVGGKG